MLSTLDLDQYAFCSKEDRELTPECAYALVCARFSYNDATKWLPERTCVEMLRQEPPRFYLRHATTRGMLQFTHVVTGGAYGLLMAFGTNIVVKFCLNGTSVPAIIIQCTHIVPVSIHIEGKLQVMAAAPEDTFGMHLTLARMHASHHSMGEMWTVLYPLAVFAVTAVLELIPIGMSMPDMKCENVLRFVCGNTTHYKLCDVDSIIHQDSPPDGNIPITFSFCRQCYGDRRLDPITTVFALCCMFIDFGNSMAQQCHYVSVEVNDWLRTDTRLTPTHAFIRSLAKCSNTNQINIVRRPFIKLVQRVASFVAINASWSRDDLVSMLTDTMQELHAVGSDLKRVNLYL